MTTGAPTETAEERLTRLAREEEAEWAHLVSKRLGAGVTGFTFLHDAITPEQMQAHQEATIAHFNDNNHFTNGAPFEGIDTGPDGKSLLLHGPNGSVHVHAKGMDFDTESAKDKKSIAHAVTLIPPHINEIQLKAGNTEEFNKHMIELANLAGITVVSADGTQRFEPKVKRDVEAKPAVQDDIGVDFKDPKPPEVKPAKDEQPTQPNPEVEDLKRQLADLQAQAKQQDKDHTAQIEQLVQDSAAHTDKLRAEMAQKAASHKEGMADLNETVENLRSELDKKTKPIQVFDAEFADPVDYAPKAKADNGTFVADEKGNVTQVFPTSRQLASGPSSQAGKRVYSPLAGPEHHVRIMDQIIDNKLGRNTGLNVRPDIIPPSRQLAAASEVKTPIAEFIQAMPEEDRVQMRAILSEGRRGLHGDWPKARDSQAEAEKLAEVMESKGYDIDKRMNAHLARTQAASRPEDIKTTEGATRAPAPKG